MRWVEYQLNTMFQVHLPIHWIVRKEQGYMKIRDSYKLRHVQIACASIACRTPVYTGIGFRCSLLSNGTL